MAGNSHSVKRKQQSQVKRHRPLHWRIKVKARAKAAILKSGIAGSTGSQALEKVSFETISFRKASQSKGVKQGVFNERKGFLIHPLHDNANNPAPSHSPAAREPSPTPAWEMR